MTQNTPPIQKRRLWYATTDHTPREQCPCCDYFTLPERGTYLICDVCFWGDEGLDIDKLDEGSGPNGITLREGRENFKKIGASKVKSINNVIDKSERKNFKYSPRNIDQFIKKHRGRSIKSRIFTIVILFLALRSINHFQKKAPIIHTDKPIAVKEMPDDVATSMTKTLNSEYGKNILKIGKEITDKKVIGAISGSSGYILKFEDNSYIVSYLDEKSKQLIPILEKGEPSKDDISLINSKTLVNGYKPIDNDLPHANEYNDMDKELNNTIGKIVTGVSVGENDYSIDFPDGLELEATLPKDKQGNISLRVFWEQW